MNSEQLETISEAVELRIHQLIEKEGDLGRLALSVANAYHSLEILAHSSTLPPKLVETLGDLIVAALIFAVGTTPNARFAAVYEQASQILEDAEGAMKASRGMEQKVRDLLNQIELKG